LTVPPGANEIGRVKEELPENVTLLGFCGAPWTLATYMIAGAATPDQLPAREFAYRHPDEFGALTDILVEAAASYLIRQFEAGADAVQIFDTWAGVVASDEFDRCCIDPCTRIAAAVRARIPAAKIIGFPRGAGSKLRRYIAAVPVDAVGLDWTIDLGFAREQLQTQKPIQGNLDPVALLVGGKALDLTTDPPISSIRSSMSLSTKCNRRSASE
jgi:uroporphyrinogen decarboxylase